MLASFLLFWVQKSDFLQQKQNHLNIQCRACHISANQRSVLSRFQNIHKAVRSQMSTIQLKLPVLNPVSSLDEILSQYCTQRLFKQYFAKTNLVSKDLLFLQNPTRTLPSLPYNSLLFYPPVPKVYPFYARVSK